MSMMEEIREETDLLQFRDPNQPDLHIVYWTRGELEKKDGANVLFWIHGICDHSGRYKHVAQRVLNEIETLDIVMSCDLRGHGKSKGERGVIKGIEQLVDDICTHVLPHMLLRYGTDARVVLAGHSLGGCIAAGIAARPDFIETEGYGKFVGIYLSSPSIKIFSKGFTNKLLSHMSSVLLALPIPRTMTKWIGLETSDLCHDEDVQREYKEDDLVYVFLLFLPLSSLFLGLSFLLYYSPYSNITDQNCRKLTLYSPIRVSLHVSICSHDRISLGVGGDLLSYGRNIIKKVVDGEEMLLTSEIPTTIICSPDDEIVDCTGSRDLIAALQEHGKGRATLIEVKGGRHELMHEPDEIGKKQFFDSLLSLLTEVFPVT